MDALQTFATYSLAIVAIVTIAVIAKPQIAITVFELIAKLFGRNLRSDDT
ncbi:hypothetical protein KFU94_35550 [Chloroflexi bacterium TSY]|nr:hypothetical protein [Chloroflexi bacterium TSY]